MEILMAYQNLTDKELVDLIFQMEDRLDTTYLTEVKYRSQSLLPLLCDIGKKEKYYRMDSIDGWGIVHAVYILGILADHRAMDAFLAASIFAEKHDIDWIWDALPECYLRIGPTAIPELKTCIEKDSTRDELTVSSEIYGLWNIWDVYPDTRKEIEDFFLEIIKSTSENCELKTNLIGDFAMIKRRDLRPLFEEYFENGEVDLTTLSRSDLDAFYDDYNGLPGFRFDLEAFYSPEEVAIRQQRWESEKEEEYQQDDIEEFILENFSKIGRNESCPCNSGKKFKKCHLQWAEEELNKVRIEKNIEEEEENYGQLIFIERHYESILRRFLASKGKAAIFNEMKEKIVEVIKMPQDELRVQGVFSYLNPFLTRIEFQSQKELKEFMGIWTEYHNALAGQYIGHPKNGKQLH